MEMKELIDKFFESGNIALIGATNNKAKFGNKVFHELRNNGFNILPVNHHSEFIEEKRCFREVQSLPSNIENAIFVIHPEETEKVVKQLTSTGIKRVWMQNGSESEKAIEFCKKNDIEVISKKCVLMHAPPVKSFHKFHRTVWRLIGKL